MNKRNIIIIVPCIISIVSMQDKRPDNERYVEIVQAIVASPKSAGYNN